MGPSARRPTTCRGAGRVTRSVLPHDSNLLSGARPCSTRCSRPSADRAGPYQRLRQGGPLPDRHGRALGQRRTTGHEHGSDPAPWWTNGLPAGGQASIGSKSATTVSSGPPTPTTARPRSRWFAAPRPAAISTRGRTPAGTAPATTSSRPSPRSWTASARTTPPWSSSGSRKNYFFALSKYQAARGAVPHQPVVLRARALPQRGPRLAGRRPPGFLGQPIGHGVGDPFPGDEAHRIYVWFDASTNYVTGAGFRRRGRVREVVAGRRPRHRQEHHFASTVVLAGHAHERRAAAAAAGIRPRLHAHEGREDVEDPRQHPRSDQALATFGVDGVRYLVLREIPYDATATSPPTA